MKTRKKFMLSPAKSMMAEYKTLLVNMALDSPTNQQAKLNYEKLYDLQVCVVSLASWHCWNLSMPSLNLHKLKMSMCVI